MTVQIDEFILGTLCAAPFVVVWVGMLYILMAGDPCEEDGE